MRTKVAKLPTIHVVKQKNLPIFQQLQWEEALLRADTRNWCILNAGSPPAIVMGISGKYEELISAEKILRAPLPVIRRFSGGGTVVVDPQTLFVTLIIQSSDVPIPPFPRFIMEWTAQLYRPLFKTNADIFKENDYVLGEKKWGGNAQSIIKGRWLHHSSILWDFQEDLMDYLHFPKKTPSYREGRSHKDFLCTIRDFYPDSSQFFQQFLEQMQKQFTLVETTQREIEEIGMKPHRKATEWIKEPLKGTEKCSINTFCTSGSAS